MPIKKTQLSREEQARHLLRAQELQAAGLDCEFPNELQENFHDLDIFVAPFEKNILCELSLGVTAYAIWVKLIALRSNLRVKIRRIGSDWDSESIALCQNQRGLYRVGQAVDFTEQEALNHRIENGLHFHHRGDVAEGWLVASGHKPIPDNYRNWMITTLSLTFTDQFGHDYSAHTEAVLQRGSGLKNSVSRERKSPGLFDTGYSENEVPTRTVKQLEGRGGTQHQPRRQHDDGSVPQAWTRSVPAE